MRPSTSAARRSARALETAGAWLLGVLWVLPLAYAFWTAFHPSEFSTRFVLTAPLTLENFVKAWHAAPFARYFLNTVILVTMVLAAQLVLVTLAAYAFARFEFPGRNVAFALVLVQLMIMPDVLIVENYRTMTALGHQGHDPVDRPAVHGERVRHLPAAADVQDGAARARRGGARRGLLAAADAVEGLRAACAADCTSRTRSSRCRYHWNNFLWPLIITNSVESRPVTVGLQVFSSTDQGIDWSIISAATLLTTGPLLVAFLLFQRQFVQSFMRAGIR